MTTVSLPRRPGLGSMVLGLPAGRRRDEGRGGTWGAQGWCDGEGWDRVAGGHWGLLLPSRFRGDGVGLMQCHTPAPQSGRCGGPAGGTAVPPVPLRRRMGSDHLVSALGP